MKSRKQRLSLNDQCVQLGVPLTLAALPKSTAGWEFEGRIYDRPERAAASIMTSGGWTCATCEGGPILLLLKAACLERLMELNTLGETDSLTRFLEAQFFINKAEIASIIEAIGRSNAAQVRRNFERIYAAGVGAYYPRVSGDLIEQLHHALGARLSGIATRFASDPYSYRAGWPDITAVKGGLVLFREVKTTDKLHDSQLNTITNVLLAEGLKVDVLRIVPTLRIDSDDSSIT